MKNTNNIYEEKIASKWTTGLLVFKMLIISSIMIYLIWTEPIQKYPVLNLFFWILFFFFLAVTINFSRLSVEITGESIIVGYGILKEKILLENIEDCYLDKTSAIYYGGWGIRISRINGKWRKVYNTVGEPRVVLLLKAGRFREFVFSTKNPEEIINLIKEQIKK